MPRYQPNPDELRHLDARLAERLAGFAPNLRARNQVLGRRSTVGCVALEITQRCNLDCTLCYLSDYSESVPDPPLAELKAKVDRIKHLFGVQTNVQITGGDPTLRKREELVEIVRYVSAMGLSPALLTNGIKASRDLLAELRSVGLVDVAFHVDTTQERKGFTTEAQLNDVREEYLARARGLGLAVIFNTTVHDGNLDEIGPLVKFFVGHAGELGMASFQLGADTGRGVVRKRGAITQARMRRIIEDACSAAISWDSVLIGHPDCHSIGYTLVVGGERVIDLLDDRALVERFLADFATVALDRSDVPRSALAVARHVFTQEPAWLVHGAPWIGRLATKVARAMAKTRSTKIGKLSFFMQNFMDADALVQERLDHCSFMVATRDGAVSMCEHNARRDDYIVPPNLVRGVDIRPSRPAIASVPRDDEHRPLRR